MPSTRKRSEKRFRPRSSGRSSRRSSSRRRSGGTTVPSAVQSAAQLAFELKKLGFQGATETGWKRARKLAKGTPASVDDLRVMRAWFARHRFASLPTYDRWVKAGKPRTDAWKRKRGIIAVLCWGGTPAMRWVESANVSRLLDR
jgi:hypothetical protein